MKTALLISGSICAAPVLLAAGPQADVLLKLLVPPMTAVTRLVVSERWDSRLDEFVQRAPVAASLGDKWTSSAAGWQQARRAVGVRVTRLVDAYAASGELTRVLRDGLAADFPGAEAGRLAATLNGAAGPAILWQQASTAFVVEAMSDRPDGPKPGSADWLNQYTALTRTFTARIGPLMPAADVRHEADAMAFARDPAGQRFGTLWMRVLGKAETTLTGAINLMLFDDREAIAREFAQAVATVKKSDARR